MMSLWIVPETYFSAQEQLLLFGGACLLGLPAGILFDAARVLRRMLPHHSVLVALEDVLCILAAGILLLGYTHAFARGEFRLFYAIGCFLGFVLYECTIGRLVVGVLCRIGRCLLGIASICKKVLVRFVGTSKNTENAQKNHKNPLQDTGEMVYNK